MVDKLCKCGCGGIIISKREKTLFLPGHQNKNKFISRAFPDEIRYCQCGCNQIIPFIKRYKYSGWPKTINSHMQIVFRKGKIIEQIYSDKNTLKRLHQKPQGFGDNVRERQLGRTLAERFNSDEKAKSIKEKLSNFASRPYDKRFRNPDNVREKRRLARLGKTYKDLFGEERALQISKAKGEKYAGWGVSMYEKPILDALEKAFGYKIDRNYWIAIHNSNKRYKIDGFCKPLNLAVEIDENYHRATEAQMKKDKEREDEIQKINHCEFLRLRVPPKYSFIN